MELAYQEYVKRLNYDPYQWPPDISLAELHSRVSQQGPVNPSGVKCPCCNFQSKKKFKGWLMKDIAEDCRGYGTAIPAFFGLLMYYIFAIFFIICINTIYQLWAVYYTCNEVIPVGEKSCLKFGYFYFIDMNTQISILQESGNGNIATTLIILQTIAFYSLMLVNLSSLVYLYKMEKQEQREMQNRKFNHHALIIGNIPEIEPKKIIEKLKVSSKLEILDIIPLKQFKRYYELFHKRNLIYYKLMSKYVTSQDPRIEKKLNNNLIQVHNKVLEEKQKIKSQKNSNLLVFFKHSFSRTLVLDQYSLNQLKKLQFGSKQLVSQLGISGQKWQLPIYVLKVPDVNEIKWQNAGENIKSKLAGRIKTFLIALGLVLLSLLIFYVPITWQLSTEASNPAKLSTWQKILPLLISIVLFVISMLYSDYMRSVAKKRFPLSQFQASKFVLMSSMLFHVLFYILVPVLFFAIPNYIGSTAKLFVIAEQAHTFVVLQVITNLIDLPYQTWKSKKVNKLSDQRQGFKYNQRLLHQQVEFRDFPLEFRIQSTFKIWSFVLFYVFYIPYMMIYMFVALVILYILEKYNFYHHYALRRAISLQLQKSFLIYFVNFFGLFQCLSYCLNATQNWMIISAVIVTVGLLIANLVLWKCIQPRYNKSKQYKKGMEQQLVEAQREDDPQLIQNIHKTAYEYRSSYEIFKELNINDSLDDQIDEYIRSLDKDVTQEYRKSVNRSKQVEKKEVERCIQLTNSQMENNME